MRIASEPYLLGLQVSHTIMDQMRCHTYVDYVLWHGYVGQFLGGGGPLGYKASGIRTRDHEACKILLLWTWPLVLPTTIYDLAFYLLADGSILLKQKY